MGPVQYKLDTKILCSQLDKWLPYGTCSNGSNSNWSQNCYRTAKANGVPSSNVKGESLLSIEASPSLSDTTHSQQTDIQATGGIRTNNPSKQAAANTRLRTREHRVPQLGNFNFIDYIYSMMTFYQIVVSRIGCWWWTISLFYNVKWLSHCRMTLNSEHFFGCGDKKWDNPRFL
jgi:hypothetical protein